MRVAIDITTWSSRRGYGRFTRGVVRGLAARPGSHELLLLSDDHIAEDDGFALPQGAEPIVVPTRRRTLAAASREGRRSLGDLRRMRRAVRRLDPDLVFFPTVYSYFPAGGDAAVVVGIHDLTPETFPRLVFPSSWRRLLWSAKSRLARRRAGFVVTVSEYSRQRLVEHFRLDPGRVRVVSNAPDPVFRPLAQDAVDASLLARWGIEAAEPLLLYVGGVDAHKNLPALLGVVDRLRRTPGLERLRLLLAGEGSDDPFGPGLGELESERERLGLEGHVRFAGFVPDAELVHLCHAARLLVLPSLVEGFGLPAVEAAACGTPVVATRNSPLPELLEGGGIFVDPARPEELYAGLLRLLQDEELRLRSGARAREMAHRLSWERSADQLRSIFDEIGDRREARG